MSRIINSVGADLRLDISQALNQWLNYRNSIELRIITNEFKIDPMTSDKYDYGAYMDAILFYCNASLENSINILQFINNEYTC